MPRQQTDGALLFLMSMVKIRPQYTQSFSARGCPCRIQEGMAIAGVRMLKRDSDRNMLVMEENRHTLRSLLIYLEEALGDKAYLSGDLSLIDIDILPRFLRMESYGAIPTPSLPRLTVWLQRMKERPTIKAIL